MEHNILKVLAAIYDCQTACRYCFNACLEEENINHLRRCIKLNVECADICEVTASGLAYTDDLTQEILAVCIKACHECAEECSKHQYLHCIECAKACRECVAVCSQYLTGHLKSA